MMRISLRGWFWGMLGVAGLFAAVRSGGADPLPIEVELPQLRGEHYKVFRTGNIVNGAAEYRMSVHGRPIHYRQLDAQGIPQGGWLDIDPAFAADIGDRYVFSRLGGAAVLEVMKTSLSYVVRKGPSWVRMEGPSALLVAREGNVLKYRLPDGTAHRIVVGPVGVQQITTMTSALDHVPAFRFHTSGDLARQDGQGPQARYEFTHEGQRLFGLGKAEAWEAGEGRRGRVVADVTIRASDDAVQFDLGNHGLQYPYEVDPTTYYADSNNARTYAHSTTFSTARNAASSTDAINTVSPGQANVDKQNTTYYVERSYLPFDTTGIPDTASITQAVLKLYIYGSGPTDNQSTRVELCQGTWPVPLAQANWDDFSYTSGGSIAVASLSHSAYNSITLNSTGLGWVDKAGTTKITAIGGLDFDNTVPTGTNVVAFQLSDAANDPTLEVTYFLAPTVTSITPSSGKNYAGVFITNLAGTNFTGTTQVKLTKTGQSDIVMTGLSVVSDTEIEGTLPISGAATGDWNVVVANPAGTATLANGFTVNDGTPAPTSATPSSAKNYAATGTVTIGGSSFTGTTQVKLTKPLQSDILMTGLSVVSDTQIQGTFPISGAATGAWSVVVTNPGGSGTLANGFTVNDGKPVPTAITPATGVNNAAVSITDLAGSSFTNASSVVLRRSGEADIAMAVTSVTDTRIQGSFPITDKTRGIWDVRVTNPGGASTAAVTFTITEAAPTLASISPDHAQNQGPVSATITGTHLVDVSPDGVRLKRSGQADIVATSFTNPGSTQITATFELTGKATGAWDLQVATATGTETLPDGFSVTSATVVPPSVLSVSPSSGMNIGPLSLAILGSGFDAGGVSVKLRKTAATTEILATGVVVESATRIRCDVNLVGAAVGDWDVVVETSAGPGILPAGFTVRPGTHILRYEQPSTAALLEPFTGIEAAVGVKFSTPSAPDEPSPGSLQGLQVPEVLTALSGWLMTGVSDLSGCPDDGD